jgi:hypothetical protein
MHLSVFPWSLNVEVLIFGCTDRARSGVKGADDMEVFGPVMVVLFLHLAMKVRPE